MNEPFDPLETELASLRPHQPSPGLEQRVGERLGVHPLTPGPSPPKGGEGRKRLRRVLAAAGLAAACLAAAVFLWPSRPPASTGSGLPNPPVAHAPEGDSLPTLQAYRHALAKSPDELDALLDEHAARASRTEPPGGHTFAFPRSDLEIRALIGEP